MAMAWLSDRTNCDLCVWRSGLCCSTNPRQTFMPARLNNVPSREAVKFNVTVHRAATFDLQLPKQTFRRSGATVGSAANTIRPASVEGLCKYVLIRFDDVLLHQR